MILEEKISNDLKKIIKKGDFDAFKTIISDNSIHVSSKLYGKRESSCWPLLQKTLNDSFTNRNYLGRLEIANYIIKNGGNINDTAPYKCSSLTSFLNQHYYLKDTKATYEVYLHTLIFVLEIVRQDTLDVNFLEKRSFGILDAAFRVFDFHTDSNNEELIKVSFVIIKELMDKGAKLEDPLDSYSKGIKLKVEEYANNK
jgi:hypothetical protein